MTERDERYSRQTILEVIGEAGQRKLSASSVVIVGLGALGSTIAALLARAGVGRLRLIDRDIVELSNLQRQILFDEADARSEVPKAVAAAAQLARVNSEIVLEPYPNDLDAGNAEVLLSGFDLIMDGTDNFETRYVMNEVAVKTERPWVYAGAVGTYGVVMPVIPRVTPCLRCVFPSMAIAGGATCDTVGVLGPLISVIGGMAATEGLKLLVGDREAVRSGLTWVDLWHNSHQYTELSTPTAGCVTCVQSFYEMLERGPQVLTARLCGRDAIQVRPTSAHGIDLDVLAERLGKLGPVQRSDHLVRTRVDGYELSVFRDARAIIKGTEDISVARTVYARYVGQ